MAPTPKLMLFGDPNNVTQREMIVAAKSWLEFHDKEKSVAWFSVGIVGRDAKVKWVICPLEYDWEKQSKPSQEDFESLIKYTETNKDSLALQSISRFQGIGAVEERSNRAPFLYRKTRSDMPEIGAAYMAVPLYSMDGASPEPYHKAVPEDCTTMLFPIVHWDGSSPRHVAALVVCATVKSQIWARLPELKALVLPLAEPLRHSPEYGVLPSVSGTNALRLLRTLLLREPLFQGDNHNFSRNTCETLSKQFADVLDLLKLNKCCGDEHFPICCARAHQFYKTLFFSPASSADVGLPSHSLWGGAADKEWALASVKFVFEQLGVKEVALNAQRFLWPTAPGLLGAVLISRVAHVLGVNSVNIFSDGDRCGVQMEMGATSDPYRLSQGLWDVAWRSKSAGDSTDAIHAAMFANVRNDIHQFRMGEGFWRGYEELFKTSDKPVMYPEFNGEKMTLWWRLPKEGASLGSVARAKYCLFLDRGEREVCGLAFKLKESCERAAVVMVDETHSHCAQIVVSHGTQLRDKIAKSLGVPTGEPPTLTIMFVGSTSSGAMHVSMNKIEHKGPRTYVFCHLKTSLAEVDCNLLITSAVEAHAEWSNSADKSTALQKICAFSI